MLWPPQTLGLAFSITVRCSFFPGASLDVSAGSGRGALLLLLLSSVCAEHTSQKIKRVAFTVHQ